MYVYTCNYTAITINFVEMLLVHVLLYCSVHVVLLFITLSLSPAIISAPIITDSAITLVTNYNDSSELLYMCCLI